MGAASSTLMSAGAKEDPGKLAPRLAKPITAMVVTLSGAPLAGPFDGLKPNPLFSVRHILEHRRAPSQCAVKNEAKGLTWTDRIFGVTVVYAQGGGRTGAYWVETSYQCGNDPPVCQSATLPNTAYDPDSEPWGGFQSSPICCPGTGGCSCGAPYPWCDNGDNG
jgi:hypothetical protein